MLLGKDVIQHGCYPRGGGGVAHLPVILCVYIRIYLPRGGSKCSGYVRKYLDVKNRAFLCDFMRDFDHLYAKFLSENQT